MRTVTKTEKEALEALQLALAYTMHPKFQGPRNTLTEERLPGRVVMAMCPEERAKLKTLKSDHISRIRLDYSA